MGGPGFPDRETRRFGHRLQERSTDLSAAWLAQVERTGIVDRHHLLPWHQLLDRLPDLIERIAAVVDVPQTLTIAADAEALAIAADLGTRRFHQRASVRQLMQEFDALDIVIEDFLEREIATGPDIDASTAVRALRQARDAVQVLQQKTVEAFVGEHLQTIERQTEQLRKFSRVVSHEVRQPLGVLQVIAKALPTGTGDDDAMRMMDIFNRSVSRLAEVTGTLERLARMTGLTDVSPGERSVDLGELVRGVARQLAPMAHAHGVDIVIRSDLPVVRLDAARTELVFMNLIANGIKYCDTAKRRRLVEVSGVHGEMPGALVRDNGVGIPASRLQHIFREFVRAHAQRHDETYARELGLGLSIVRECMDAANGLVRVESIEGAGTTFRLTWPLR